jgi:hypothetical protein
MLEYVSRGNWIILIIGTLVSVWVFRRNIEKPKSTLKAYEQHLNNDDLKYSPERRRALFEKETYTQCFIFSISFLILATTNWQYNYVSGPILLAAFGLGSSYLYYALDSISTRVQLIHEKDSTSRDKNQFKISSMKKNFAISLIIFLAISGNWEYRIQKDSNEQMQYATNEALDLVGTGWCANFWDINAEYYPEVEPIKTGGWPCINVGSVTDVRFSKIKSHLEMCFSYSLTRSDGLPSQDSIYEYDYKKLCSTDSWYVNDGGWSTKSLGYKIFEVIKDDLDELEIQSCRKFYYTLTEDERIVYC